MMQIRCRTLLKWPFMGRTFCHLATLDSSLLGTDLDVLLIHLLLDSDVLGVLNCLQDWTPTQVQDHLQSCNDIVAKRKVLRPQYVCRAVFVQRQRTTVAYRKHNVSKKF
jgi:hypothetical protein